MSLETFRRAVRRHNTLMLQIYDQLGGNQDAQLASVAYTHDNRRNRERKVTFDKIFAQPQVRAWDTGPVEEGAFERIEWSVKVKGWAAAISFDEEDEDRKDTLMQIEQAVRQLPAAFMDHRVQLLGNVFAKNPLTYDGNDLYSSSHPHPLNKGYYDNTFFFDLSNPTQQKVFDFIKEVQLRFLLQLTLNTRWVSGDQPMPLRILVADPALYAVFKDVMMNDRLDKDGSTETFTNTLKGSFAVTWARDLPTSYAYCVWAAPKGPRPIVFVPDKDPWLDVERGTEGQAYGKRFAVMKAIYMAASFFPQATIRAQIVGGG